MTNAFFYLTLVLFLIVCSILMLLVLIQKGRGGGLASAFGGGGGNTAFGSKTGDVLTWATSVVFGVFLLLAVLLNLLANASNTATAGVAPLVVPTPAVPAESDGTPGTQAPLPAPGAGVDVSNTLPAPDAQSLPSAEAPAVPPAVNPTTAPTNP